MNHMVVSTEGEPPSNLEMLVGLVQKTATESGTGWLHSISIRMPMIQACTIDAIAQYSGKSRNQIIVKSLYVALDALFEQLPEAEQEELYAIRSRLLEERFEAKSGESGEL